MIIYFSKYKYSRDQKQKIYQEYVPYLLCLCSPGENVKLCSLSINLIA